MESETCVPRIKEFSPAKRGATLAQLERLGLEIPCLTAGYLLNGQGNPEELISYMDLAKVLRTPYIRVLGDNVIVPGTAVSDDMVIQEAKTLAKIAEEKGVTLLIETNGVYGDSARLRNVLDQIDSPAVAALWDIHHPYRFFHEAPKTTVDHLGSYIRHVHCKDSILENDQVKYRIMGQGDVPVFHAMLCLEDMGYEGFYSLEWVRRWDLTLEAPGIAFTQFLRYMKHGF